MPEFPGSSLELNRISHQAAPSEQHARTAAAEEGNAGLAGDQIRRSAQSGRRSKLPSFRTVAGAVISAGFGAGAYRFGEFADSRIQSRRYRAGQPENQGSAPFNETNLMLIAGRINEPDSTNHTYAYMGNLRVNHTILTEFQEVASIMLKNQKANETLQFLLNAKPNFLGNELTVNPAGDGEFDPIANIITWDPHTKLAVPNSNSSDILGAISPLGALTHEAFHAEHALENLPGMLIRLACPDPNYDNKEERLTIEQTNARLANFPGEAQRSDHHIGMTLPAENVTDNTLTGLDVSGLPDNAEDIERLSYSKYSALYPTSLRSMYQQSSDFMDAAVKLGSYFPSSFNNSNVEKLSALSDEGRSLAIAYGTGRNGFSVPAAFIEADENYTRRVHDFVNNVYADSRNLDMLTGNNHSQNMVTRRAESPANAPAATLAPQQAPQGTGGTPERRAPIDPWN